MVNVLARYATRVFACFLVGCTLTGCTEAYLKHMSHYQDRLPGKGLTDAHFYPIAYESDPVGPKVIRAKGYASISLNKKLSEAQRRLMAIRASKLDAYRTLAEQIYGLKISGKTKLNDMHVADDHFNSVVETTIHGAQVISSKDMGDGTFETVVELVVDHGFRNCLAMAGQQRFNIDCRLPSGAHHPAEDRIDPKRYPALSNDHKPSSTQNAISQFYYIE